MLIAALLGSAWRRWFGSARPSWAYPGYRATQILAGLAALFGLGLWTGEEYWRAALDAALAIGFMTLPISISRQPFVWVMRKLNLPTTDHLPHPWKPMLQGPEPWAEAAQGMSLWLLAVSL
jgi:hypothetical protein